MEFTIPVAKWYELFVANVIAITAKYVMYFNVTKTAQNKTNQQNKYCVSVKTTVDGIN